MRDKVELRHPLKAHVIAALEGREPDGLDYYRNDPLEPDRADLEARVRRLFTKNDPP